MTVPLEQIALVKSHLPSAAKDSEENGGYGWTDEFIETLMETTEFNSPAKAVRYFWYQRVQETAEYIDVGKPITQIHRQAQEMLAYWDKILGVNPTEMIPVESSTGSKSGISFGEIERPW